MLAEVRQFARLLRERPAFRRLWLSTIISLLGDWLSYVAVSIIALHKGQGALSVGLVMAAHTLPVALLSPIAGPLADRVDRRTLMVGAYLGAAALTLAMWGTALSGDVLLMQGLLLARVSVSGIGMTARTAALPALVEAEELHLANALAGLTWSVLFAAGVALGGLIAAALGASAAILLDAASFVLAALVVLGLPRLPPAPAEATRPRPGLRDLAAAWRYARPQPRLLSTLLAKVPFAIASAGTWVTLNMVAAERFALSAAAGLGVMHAVRGVGTGVGPLLPRHWIPREPLLAGPLAFGGMVLFTLSGSAWLFLPALFLWGAGTGHNWVASTSELQQATPRGLLGRVTAFDFMGMSLVQAVVAVAAGLVIDATGLPHAGVWLGVGLGVPVWVLLMYLRRRPPA